MCAMLLRPELCEAQTELGVARHSSQKAEHIESELEILTPFIFSSNKSNNLFNYFLMYLLLFVKGRQLSFLFKD